ncbi:MAG: YerC/YecD family TrpR-related protein [Andreesenia angusta]|nr:YerC/YecD family TrpR-related protein [Andreesenia angusta]
MPKYRSKLEDKETDILFEAILSLKSIEDCYRFFEDVCTVKEIKSMTQRFHVARLLDEGKKYTEIEEETNASTATISRISRVLNYGEKGYEIGFKSLKKKNK